MKLKKQITIKRIKIKFERLKNHGMKFKKKKSNLIDFLKNFLNLKTICKLKNHRGLKGLMVKRQFYHNHGKQ